MGIHSKVRNLFKYSLYLVGFRFKALLQLTGSNSCELIDGLIDVLMRLPFVNYTLRFQEILLLPWIQTAILCCKI